MQTELINSEIARALVEQQCNTWDTAHTNFEAISQVKTREISLTNYIEQPARLQFNPARILSSAAKIDTLSLAERPCFLCANNRPKAQLCVPFMNDYEILVNPYPIFPYHLTIPAIHHQPQRIERRLGIMLQLAQQLNEFVIFYNGPKCGASAPDHAHFQAGNQGILPIEQEPFFEKKGELPPIISEYQEATLRSFSQYSRPFFEIRATKETGIIYLFSILYNALEIETGKAEEEPMMNLLVWHKKSEWIVLLFPRTKHRPNCYEAIGEDNISLSPGCVDMGGLFAISQKKDFDKITASDLESILGEICYSPEKMHAVTTHLKS